jgi:hypothetical protein
MRHASLSKAVGIFAFLMSMPALAYAQERSSEEKQRRGGSDEESMIAKIVESEFAAILNDLPSASQAALRSKGISVRVGGVDSVRCAPLGALGWSEFSELKSTIVVCGLPSLALARAINGGTLFMERLVSNTDLSETTRLVKIFWKYEVGRYADMQVSSTLGVVESRKHCQAIDVVWMVLQGRKPESCENISDNERLEVLGMALRYYRRIAGGQDLDLEQLKSMMNAAFFIHLRQVVRFAIAHELGHLDEVMAVAAVVDRFKENGVLVTPQAAREFAADMYALQRMRPGPALAVSQLLSLFWSSLREIAPRQLPLADEISFRAQSMYLISGCAGGTFEAVESFLKDFPVGPSMTGESERYCKSVKEVRR